jgi:hypothetical protein
MRIVVLDGKTVDTSVSIEIEKQLRLKLANHNICWIKLKDKKIKPCMGCFGCWIKTPGLCAITDDDATDITREMINSDLLIELSPVTFGGYSFDLKKMLDRSIPILLPYFKRVKGEIHHHQRYEKLPRQLMVGYMDVCDPISAACYIELTGRNALNMQPPKWASVVIDNQSKVLPVLDKAINEVME